MKIAILRNEDPGSGIFWETACQKADIEADIIDLCSMESINILKNGGYDLCLLRPPGAVERYKSIYDEKLYHIHHFLKIPCYPSFFECFIYENKKNLAAFLEFNGISHPKTKVICYQNEAMSFVQSCRYPIVAKTSIGAAGSGVIVLRDLSSAKTYINKAFNGGGIKKRFGPNKQVGTPKSWLQKALGDPAYLKKKLLQYFRSYAETQRGYVIFQEYIDHEFEWRIVRIGDSYFAYKKFKVGDKASGAKNLGFGNPPLALMSWIRDITIEFKINSAAFDVFVSNGQFLINEIQTIFGHKMDHILEIDGKPGRYLHENGEWVFEEGMFNSNKSFDLRLEAALKLYRDGVL